MATVPGGLHGPKLQTAVNAYGDLLAEGGEAAHLERIYQALAQAPQHELTLAELVEQRADGLPDDAGIDERTATLRTLAEALGAKLLMLGRLNALPTGYAVQLVRSKPEGAFQLFGLHLVESKGLLAPEWRRDLEGARALEDRIHAAFARLPLEGRPEPGTVERLHDLAKQLAKELAGVIRTAQRSGGADR